MKQVFARKMIRFAFAVTACFFTSQTTAVAQTQQNPSKVRYQETTRSVSYAASYVALAKNFFKEEGIDVDFQTAQGSDKVMAALLSGNADVALTGPEFPLYIWHGKSPLKVKIVCGLVATDSMFLLRREKKVGFEWSETKGKKILGWRRGSTPTLFLDAALRKNGINPSADVDINDNIGVSARYGAFLSGVADYGIFFEPEASRLQREGAGTIVASIGEAVGPIDFTVFSVSDDYIKHNPKTVQAWTNAIYRAQRWVKTSSRDELADVLVPFFPGIAREDLLASIDSHREKQLWKTEPLVRQEFLRKFEDILIAGEALQRNQYAKYEDVVDRSFADHSIKIAP
jgi:NitT/TauT family transport system substrate-binding protein